MKKYIIILSVFFTIFVAGCGKSVEITEYPAFYTPELKHVVVLPFENAAYHYRAGQKVADDFARTLARNGTYQVLNMANRPQEVGMPHHEEFRTLMRRLRAQGLQAAFVGTIEAYDFNESVDYSPSFAGPDYGDYGYPRYSPAFVNQQITYTATVKASVTMINLKNGYTIAATEKPIEGVSSNIVNGFFVNGQVSKEALFKEATDQVVAKMVKKFSVTNQTIHLHEKSFVVGHLEKDGVFKKSSHIKVGQDGAIVLTLPATCALNTFTVRVRQIKPWNKNILSQSTVWPKNQTKKLYQLGPLEPGKYQAELIHSRKMVFKHNFKTKSE